MTVQQKTDRISEILANNNIPNGQASVIGQLLLEAFQLTVIDESILIQLQQIQQSGVLQQLGQLNDLSKQIQVLYDNDVALNTEIEKMLKTMTDLQNDVAAQKSVSDGLAAAIKGIADQIRATSPDAQSISDLADQVEANTANITKAVTDNTPVTPAQVAATT